MTEDVLLERTLAIAGAEGYGAAYDYLLRETKDIAESGGAQVCYYLMCLASGCGMTDKALGHVAYADARGWWYRADAVADDDLAPLKGMAPFDEFLLNCAAREYEARRDSAAMCTFARIEKRRLLLCLHGNGQNAAIARRDWTAVFGDAWQIEGLQSARADSTGRFRWEDDDSDWRQLADCVEKLPLSAFDEFALAGFSAGCNMILRAITLSEVCCDRLILQSPWIPFWERSRDAVVSALVRKRIRVHISCGTGDADCAPMAYSLHSALVSAGVSVSIAWQVGTAHSFPERRDVPGE